MTPHLLRAACAKACSAVNPLAVPGSAPRPPLRASRLRGRPSAPPNAVEGTARARIMRTVETQSQCRYAWWLSEPRFKPFSGAPGEWGYFAVARAEHPAGTL